MWEGEYGKRRERSLADLGVKEEERGEEGEKNKEVRNEVCCRAEVEGSIGRDGEGAREGGTVDCD